MRRISPLPPARVRTAGEILNQPFHSTPGTKQGDVMLIAILSGKGFYEDRNRIIDAGKGMIGIIADEHPGILYADRRDPYHKAYCRFGGEYARFLATGIFGERSDRFFYNPLTTLIGERLRNMGHIHRNTLPEVMTPDAVQLLDVLRIMMDHERGTGEYGQGSRLTADDVRNYLIEHIADATDLSRTARDLGVSRSTLCRIVKAETGSSVQKLHEDYKIEWAKRLLQSSRMNIAEVAYRSGYPDPYYFSKAFRKVTGSCPRNWRREYAGGSTSA